MDYVQRCVNAYCAKGIRAPEPTLAFSEVLNQDGYDRQRVNSAQAARIIELVTNLDKAIHDLYSLDGPSFTAAWKAQVAEEKRQECSNYIGNIKINYHTTIRLLRLIERQEPKYRKIRRRLFNVLFGYPNTSFYSVIQQSARPIPSLYRSENGKIEFFGIKFARKQPDNV